MGTPDMKSTLQKVEKMLAQVVGVQKVVLMTPEAFLQHAIAEIGKAEKEPQAKSRIRLASLYKSVLYSSAVIEDTEADAIKVPVFLVDQTTLEEQENDLYTPAESGKMNPSNQTVFEGGILQKYLQQLETSVAELSKLGEDIEEDDDSVKAKKEEDGKEEEGEKEKEPESSTSPGTPAAKKVKKAKVSKADEVVWPDDMNDAQFVEKGKKTEPDWGHDPVEG